VLDIMLSYGLILLVQIACLIHAGRTGRPYFWFMIILFVPGLGILAYLALAVIPGLLRGRAAARLPQTVWAGLDPTSQYREFARAVETLPSIANLRALADECVGLGRHDEAIDLYKSAHRYASDGTRRNARTRYGRIPKGRCRSDRHDPRAPFRREPGFQLH
jgi:hypothetical protein